MDDSIVSRFRKRQNLPMVLQVPWPSKSPEFILEIARFSQEEHDGASFKADGIKKDRKIEAPADGDKEKQQEYTVDVVSSGLYALAPIIWRHLKAWKHTPPEGQQPLEYSPITAKQLFDGLTYWEKVDLGLSYGNVLGEEQKKSESGAATAPGS